MQLRRGELFGKRRACKVYFAEQLARLHDAFALCEHPGDKLKLRNVAPVAARRGIDGVSDEVEPRHAQAALVHGVVVKRIALGYVRHADNGKMLLELQSASKLKRKAARHHADLVAVGKFIVKRASEIKSVRLIGRCRTHFI